MVKLSLGILFWGMIYASNPINIYPVVLEIPFWSSTPVIQETTEIMPEEVISTMAACFWWQGSLLQVMLQDIRSLLY